MFVLIVWLVPATTRFSAQWSVTGAGLILFVWSFVEFVRCMVRGRSLAKGVLGERLAADALDSLRAIGYELFHDIPDQTSAGRFCNIDHVVVGIGGIFVLETKFRSAVFNGGRVAVLSDRLEINGRPMEPDPRPQALAAMASVRTALEGVLSGTPNAIRAVVVLPRRKRGGVDNAFESPDGVWVLTPEALVKTLRKQRPVLTQQQIREACIALRGMAHQFITTGQ